MKGSLIVVGLGVLFESHLTLEALSCLQHADQVFFLANDRLVTERFQERFPKAVDLAQFYQKDSNRAETYSMIATLILQSVRAGNRVCAAFYGHPGIFVTPSHQAIHQARQEGFEAAMLPGIAADACLFADLGIDPGEYGCQTYEATDFLIRPRKFDTSSGLILWQVGLVGNLKPPGADISRGLTLLVEKLGSFYGADHKVFLYIATAHPNQSAQVYYVSLSEITQQIVSSATTMYIPPQQEPDIDTDMIKALGLT